MGERGQEPCLLEAHRARAALFLGPEYLGPGLPSGAITGLVPGFYSKLCLFPDLKIIRGKCAWSGLLCVNAWQLLLPFYRACPFYFADSAAEMASNSLIAFSAFEIAFEFLVAPSEKA